MGNIAAHGKRVADAALSAADKQPSSTRTMPPEVEELSILLNEAVAVVPEIAPLLCSVQYPGCDAAN